MMTETNCGFARTTPEQKRERIMQVFSSVAGSYDRMNDLMSFGLHRLWKRFTVRLARIQSGERVLDVAGGTGDLTRLCQPLVGQHGEVVLCDLNTDMLKLARERLLNAGLARQIRYVQGNAEHLPFKAESFDCTLMGFGLRNVANPQAALSELYRITRPGGRLLILEFSQPVIRALHPVYRYYCLHWLPKLGRQLVGDAESYRYLGESIQAYPPPQHITGMLHQAGWRTVDCFLPGGGIAALHRAIR